MVTMFARLLRNIDGSSEMPKIFIVHVSSLLCSGIHSYFTKYPVMQVGLATQEICHSALLH
jgi:hypothetical protein